MNRISRNTHHTALLLALLIPFSLFAQNGNKQDIIQKTNNTVNKASNIIAVFQPYLLKARQLFYDAKQMTTDVRQSAKNTFGKNRNSTNPNNQTTTSISQPVIMDSSNSYNQGTLNNNQNQTVDNSNNNNAVNNMNNTQATNNPVIQNYLVSQSLPVNNDASVNNDGTGNWGNQNNGLYGNCLDALTGTVMGMGEAADKPTSVDLLFFAPADGQNTYYLITPGFARNNSSVTYWTEHTSDQLQQWTDVNETEVALTKLTLGQFEQIQNNNQISNAVRNAQGYSGYYSSVEQKLDGKVFAVKAQMDNRTVYALIAIEKQIGNSGSNGYLKIKIKTQGIDGNNGQINTNAYIRQ